MKIRTRLTLTFFFLVTFILTAVSVSIYFFSATYRELDFRRRLRNRGISTANILVEFREVTPDLLRRIEKDNPSNLPNQFILVFDADGKELYRSDSVNLVPVDDAFLASIDTKREVRQTRGQYEILGFAFVDKATRYKVVAAANDLYGRDALRNLRNILGIVFGISLVGVSVIGWFNAGRVLQPISRIVQEVDRITEASLDLRLDEGERSDELEKLAQTFNRMLSRLEEAFLSQKNFIASASHELRTPVALIVAEIEATLIKADPADPQTQVLHSLLESARNLNTLANQLLLLAQTSAEPAGKHFVDVRVDEILWEVKHELETANPGYEINFHFDISLSDASMVVEGDEQLIKILFNNLIDNGCKYAFDKSIDVTLTVVDESLLVEFVNEGPGIPAEEISLIFAPFFRSGNVGKERGYGIGLSLAQRIVHLHKGTITVESHPGATTSFRVTVPRVQSA